MAQVTGMTAAEIAQELSNGVVSGRIDTASGHLLLVTRSGAVIDAGAVEADTVVAWTDIVNRPSTFAPNNYTHIQDAAAAVWTITHNLGYHPQVTIVDSAGSEVMGDIAYLDINTVRATFGGAFAGRAYLT